MTLGNKRFFFFDNKLSIQIFAFTLIVSLGVPQTADAQGLLQVSYQRNQTLLVRGDAHNNDLSIHQSKSGQLQIKNANGFIQVIGPKCKLVSPSLATCDRPDLIRVNGRSGHDHIKLNVNIESILNGGNGNDHIEGGGNSDRIRGGSGNDRLSGGMGDDILNGGNGEDELSGGEGNDLLFGNAGNDVILADPGADRISGGQGTDSVDYTGYSPFNFSVTLDEQANDGRPDEFDNVRTDVENVLGPEKKGSVHITSNTLHVWDGEDVNNTVIITDYGAPAGYFNIMTFGISNYEIGAGCAQGAFNFVVICQDFNNIEIRGEGGNDLLSVLIDRPATIYGGSGFDQISGGPGNDIIFGGAQADSIFGGGGNDELHGDSGNDRINGGNGAAPDADQIFGGTGTDIVTYFSHTTSVSVSFNGLSDDGAVGEGDNVATDVEQKATEFVSDLRVFSITSELDVAASVWSGSSTPFAIETVGDTQVVAYYEVVENAGTPQAKCLITIAARRLGTTQWTYRQLDWRERNPDINHPDLCDGPGYSGPKDTHNRIVLTIDRQGLLHIAGNMHNNYMRYWRTENSILDSLNALSTINRYPVIDPSTVNNPYLDHPRSGWRGAHFDRNYPYEKSVTYPTFQTANNGSLILTYRLGSSGNGDLWAAGFDSLTKRWSRTVDGPYLGFSPGQTTTSPYSESASWNGMEHIISTHRERQSGHFDRNMAKSLTYVRTGNWRDFQNAAGQNVQLPVTQTSVDAMVEQAIEGGIHQAHLGRDADDNPVIGYPIYDHAASPGGPFCPNELSSSGQRRVLKARVAIWRSGQWVKIDLACSSWVWGRDNPQGVPAGSPLDFWVSAPQERVINAQKVFVVFVAIKDQNKRYFVLDYETLAVISESGQAPGGVNQVKAWDSECASLLSFKSIPLNSPNYYNSPLGTWRTNFKESTGDADAGDYYRLAREVVQSSTWSVHDNNAPASRLRVTRKVCDKAN